MQKTTKKFIVAVLLFSLVTMYGSMPVARAASLDSVKDTISDSDISATGVSHTVVLNSNEDLKQGTTITYAFEAGIDLTSAAANCPTGTTGGSVSGQNIVCTIGGTKLSSTTDYTLALTDAVNPSSSGSYTVTVTATNVSDATEESVALIYIIDDVVMSASVDAALTFEVAALGTTQDVNGSNTTVASTPTTIPFGTLVKDTPTIAGQTLKVTTNAGGGFSVTVQQGADLTSAAGDTIDAAATGLSAWSLANPTLGDPTTYGKMGFTTSDASLVGNSDTFGDNLYRGFDGTTAVEVMYNDGPADGSTDNKGMVNVGYQVEVSALQEAGDYETNLTYICTPTF